MIDLLKSSPILQKIGRQELIGVQAYKIAKVLNIINSELELYDKSRQQLIKEYGQKDQNGQIKIINNQVKIENSKINEFNKKMQDLNHLEIELNISLLNINDLAEIKLTPEQIAQILWLINEENPS